MTALPQKSYVGIDLGGTNLRFALVAADGSILSRYRCATNTHLGRDALFSRIADGVGSLCREAEIRGTSVSAIGVGVPGLIASNGLILSAVNIPFLSGEQMGAHLSELTGLPAVIANDANAIAFGEKCFGAGRRFDSFLMLTLGTGIGSGLVLSGRLWTGKDGVAAEYGHSTVEPEGLLCACGNHGCLEQYASASAIARAAIREIEMGRESELRNTPAERITAEVVAKAAAGGDMLAVELMDRAGYYLGIAIASVLNLLNLEAVIIGGGVSASFPLLHKPVMREIGKRAFAATAQGVEIIGGELGDDAGLLGSAALAAEVC